VGQQKGPGKSSQPMMFYANISKPGSAYAGPRQIDAASQKTFIWGDGNYIIHFDWQIDLHSNKGQQKKSTGKTVNPDAPKKPVEKQESPESGSSSSGNQMDVGGTGGAPSGGGGFDSTGGGLW
jgi:hypothetical protein